MVLFLVMLIVGRSVSEGDCVKLFMGFLDWGGFWFGVGMRIEGSLLGGGV